ncbi:MAG: hypothetical protein ACI9UJ_000473 [bacterium]|jgi:hypothetical protein
MFKFRLLGALLLITYKSVLFADSDETTDGHRWGSSPNNEFCAIDTFFNTTTITKSHFMDLVENNLESRIVYRKPHKETSDSVQIFKYRITIAYPDSTKSTYIDSSTNRVISQIVVEKLSKAPTNTRVLIDNIRAYRIYKGYSKKWPVTLMPMFYELKE